MTRVLTFFEKWLMVRGLGFFCFVFFSPSEHDARAEEFWNAWARSLMRMGGDLGVTYE